MLQLRRCKELVSGVTITQGTLDQRAAAEGTAKADVLVAQAGIDEANINLGYTEIRSSSDGGIGIANFIVGNLAGPSSGSLAMIVSEDPIYAIFR